MTKCVRAGLKCFRLAAYSTGNQDNVPTLLLRIIIEPVNTGGVFANVNRDNEYNSMYKIHIVRWGKNKIRGER